MKHHNKGKKGHDIIDVPHAQADYVAQFNVGDENDGDSNDYSTTIRTIR